MFDAMTKLLHHISANLEACGVEQGAKLVVAASGGCDSTTLLHLLHALKYPLVVAHVNHGARGAESEGDEAFVKEWAEEHDAVFECLRLNAEDFEGDQGFQGEARKLRLSWLNTLCDKHQAQTIVMAHHADDQAETWLLQALRSVDPWSLTGMAIQEGRVIRPLLDVRREELQRLATRNEWAWREDSSNASDKYLRNRIRHEVLPLLNDVRPGTTDHFLRLAQHSQQLMALVEPLLHDAQQQAEQHPGQWSIVVLQDSPLAMESMKRKLKLNGWSDRSVQRLDDLLPAQVGHVVQHGRMSVVRERDFLVESEQALELPEPTSIGHDCTEGGQFRTANGTCSWEPGPCPNAVERLSVCDVWIPASWLPATLRCWSPGDRIQPLGMKGQSKVSDVLTQSKLSHSMRSSALILERESDGCVLWVAGHKLSEHARLDLANLQDMSGWMFNYKPTERE